MIPFIIIHIKGSFSLLHNKFPHYTLPYIVKESGLSVFVVVTGGTLSKGKTTEGVKGNKCTGAHIYAVGQWCREAINKHVFYKDIR